MAAITTASLQTGKEVLVARKDLLRQVQRLEKKNFPQHEALDLNEELKKRNGELVAILDDVSIHSMSEPTLVAYSAFVHSKPGNVVILHKVCIKEDFRRQGIAKNMLRTQIEKLKKQNCSKIQLWVRKENDTAINLYKAVGFEDMSTVDSYYGPGQTGLSMAMCL